MRDYHFHTTQSPDGKSSLTEYCRQAQILGCTEICVTDHMDIGYSKPQFEGEKDVTIHYRQVLAAQKAFPGLKIKLGIEVGYKAQSQHETAMLLAGAPFDFIINSVHEINNSDPYFPEFFEGKSRDEAYSSYLETVFESLDACYDFSVIGHIGYIARYAPFPAPQIQHYDYPDLFDAILMRIIYLGKGIEVNTSSLRQLHTPVPTQSILKRYKELGGEYITIGSDAHHAAALCTGYNEALALLKSLGYKYITEYNQLKPVQIPI